MIVGPAVLTTLLTVARTHGYVVTMTAFTLNLVIVWAVLRWATTAGYRRLWATVWDWNTASRRVLAKVGFAETERQETPHGTNCVTTRRL